MRLGAAAVFVKTPGFSPLKTRLAAGIGQERAEDFYRLACKCIEIELLAARQIVDGYWALAESSAQVAGRWSGLALIEQGEASLGHRLSQVYNQLLEADHGFVILLGADAPQLTQATLVEVVSLLNDFDFVVGPASDGGFYLMAGRLPLSQEFWLGIPYSDSKTCELLLSRLKDKGSVHCLSVLTDVDMKDDLLHLLSELERLESKNDHQQLLLTWLRSICGEPAYSQPDFG